MIRRVILSIAAASFAAVVQLPGQDAAVAGKIESANIDLPTALRLAGANNLDVRLARENLAEAQAAYVSTREQFFPWIVPAVAANRHSGNVQAFNGPISEAQKQSLAAGVALNAQLDLGDAIYQNLASRQLVRASTAMLAAQQRQTVYFVAAAYFDLSAAKGAVSAAAHAAQIAAEQLSQTSRAADAGLIFKGDVYRVETAYERGELNRRQLREQQRILAARLAELLHMDHAVELIPTEGDMAPLSLVAESADLGELIGHALAARPEMDAATARVAAAKENSRGATYAPLVPSIGAQAGVGKLGGGAGDPPLTRDFSATHDYLLALSWRIGPGGLLDFGRQHAAQAAERTGILEKAKLDEQIRREVVEHFEHLHSVADQVGLLRKTLASAEETAKLSRERRLIGVGAVLEDLLAEDELARSQRDYLTVVAEYNKAQYALRFSTGD